MLLSGTGKIVSWLLIVLFVPWATFFVRCGSAKQETNAPVRALVRLYTIAEAVLLAWLFNWHVPGATAWTFLERGRCSPRYIICSRAIGSLKSSCRSE